jgi:hypothetical protein
VHSAGAAQGDAAAELRTRDAEHIAQHPKERSVSIDVDCLRSAVDVDRECHVAQRKHAQKLDQLDERIGDTLVSGDTIVQ